MKRRVVFLAPALLFVAACSNSPAGGTSAEAAYRRGLVALEQGQPRTARILFLNAIKAHPDNGRIRVAQALTYLTLGDGIAADAELVRARQLGISIADTAHLLAHALILENQPDRAIAEAHKAAPAYAPYAARMRGRAAMMLGDEQAAEDAFDEALAAAPSDSAAGFTIPGMVAEYQLPRSTVSLVPFFALCGTVAGSFLWGVIADLYGRKASILLSAVMFVGTSICGAMPSLAWNIGMCFMMGAAAGGMLPVTYALLAEMMPSRHRGWSLVLVGGLGAVGGYVAASSIAAWLEPIFSWRILWLANLPTGLLLVLLGATIPESAKFLLASGRKEEARRVMERFGSTIRNVPQEKAAAVARGKALPLTGRAFAGKLMALSLTAICWGLVNFGLLLWMPTELVARGYSMELSSKLLAASSLLALPTVFVVAWLYSVFSTKWSVTGAIGITILGLLGVLHLEVTGTGSPVYPVALLIVGSNAIIAMLLPYAAESFPLRIRGRTTGWIAACTKLGGVFAQLLSILALIPALGTAALMIIVPMSLSLGLVTWLGRETRGRDLRDLDPDGHVFEAAGL